MSPWKGEKREAFRFLIPVYLFYIIGVVKVIEDKKIVTYPYDCSFNVAKHTCLLFVCLHHVKHVECSNVLLPTDNKYTEGFSWFFIFG